MKMNDENGSLDTKLPVFDGKNWNQWSIQMRVLFGAQDVLNLVNDGYTPIAENATKAQRRGRSIKRRCYISINVSVRMCLRKLLIRRR